MGLKEENRSESAPTLEQLIGYLSQTLFIICMIGVLGITIIVFVTSMLRYFADVAFHWNIEVIEYLFILLVFIGISELTRKGEHIGVDIFKRRLSAHGQKMVNMFILLVSLAWSVMIGYYAWDAVITAYTVKITSSTLLRFPLHITYSFLAIGFSVLTLQLLVLIWKDAKISFFPPTEEHP